MKVNGDANNDTKYGITHDGLVYETNKVELCAYVLRI